MANPLFQKHIISISDLTRPELELVVQTASQLKAEPRHDLLCNKLVASCFFEASTRTRLSFETAAQRLGGSVIGFADAGNTSLAKKGETLADSVRIITSYTDAFVIRQQDFIHYCSPASLGFSSIVRSVNCLRRDGAVVPRQVLT